MKDLVQYVAIGLGNGAVYAMIGMGLVVIFRSTGLLNFAQGEMAMFSTFFVWQLHQLGVNLWLALLGGIVGGFCLGALVHQVVIRPFGDPHQKPLAVVIVTIGLFLGLNSLAQLIWGTEQNQFDRVFGDGQFGLAGASIGWQKVGGLAVLAAEVVVLVLIFQKTKLGLGMRAVASNPESSALSGVPVNRVLMIGWGLASALGAIGGTFMAPAAGALDPNLMQLPLIYAFAAITLGGFDSLLGAVVGGLVVGVVSDVTPQYVSAIEKVPLAPAFVLILVVLLIRPQGLFGAAKVSRV